MIVQWSVVGKLDLWDPYYSVNADFVAGESTQINPIP